MRVRKENGLYIVEEATKMTAVGGGEVEVFSLVGTYDKQQLQDEIDEQTIQLQKKTDILTQINALGE